MPTGAEPTFRRLAAAAAGLALLGAGCKSGESFRQRVNVVRAALTDSGYDDPTAADRLAEAERLFADGQYPKAQEAFRTLADNKSNPADLAERARFMQAECRFKRDQYPEAVDTYHRLLMDFPTGAHRRDACGRIFEVCDYWLNDFRDETARRAEKGGIQGWRPALKNPLDPTRPFVGQEGRTLDALEHVWTHDLTGPVADKALFWCGYVNFVRGDFEDADHFFSTLCEVHKDSPLRPQAMVYAVQAKNNATGGPDYDARKCAEALQLVHLAEAGVPELTQNPEMAEKLTRARFAIRLQQAEKDFRTADYYERTGHPGSAVFYYELVRRRYAGTRYSDLAEQKKERLLALMREGKPAPGTDPFAVVGAKWREVFGKPRPAPDDQAPASPEVVPAGGPPRP
ncbi:MAG: hypothetical protein C0501_29685 [Isosphaera sp.]|nr:hypothetical protein [Isosphaera sp.]